MKTVRVTFDNGNSLVTGINGTEECNVMKKLSAEQAIEKSIETNSIVHISYGAEAVLTLGAECEDNVRTQDEEGNGVWEYWGEDEDGSTWRVHVNVEAK